MLHSFLTIQLHQISVEFQGPFAARTSLDLRHIIPLLTCITHLSLFWYRIAGQKRSCDGNIWTILADRIRKTLHGFIPPKRYRDERDALKCTDVPLPFIAFFDFVRVVNNRVT